MANPTTPLGERLLSLDVYRGLIMISLAFNGFGLKATADLHLKNNPDSWIWQTIQYQFEHVEWVGLAYWDMIQPSFMFMVGVSMAYSYVKRRERGQSWLMMFGHALIRSLILIALGVFLVSSGSKYLSYTFMNVLTQIGLGYWLLFLFWRRPWWLQLGAIGLICVGMCVAYSAYPTSGISLETGNADVGIPKAWAELHLKNVPPAWHKSTNLGHELDRKILNFIPHPEAYRFNRGGYQTINFITSLATMLLGLMCGELLRSQRNATQKLVILFVAGLIGVALGLIWHWLGCPIIKRLWTPSWVLLSGGIAIWILATLYGLIDVLGWRFWTWPITVVGMNSIAIYCMSMLLKSWTASMLKTVFDGPCQYFFHTDLFLLAGPMNEPLLRFCCVGLAFWTICLWMYLNRIFVRI